MSKIVVFLNGKAGQVEEQVLIPDLLKEAGLDPKMILVEHNRRVLLRGEWPDISLKHGDRLEFLRVVAGG
ncbi:MAG: sulfur carrier protein ThiS [Methylacidiphilales bacterium]|nr:sulfur carrier protein ThiS [Candidatus Methylacidiphilales bacterium]